MSKNILEFFFKLEVLDSQAKTTVDDVLEGFRERNLLEKLIDDSYVVRNLSTAKEVIGGAVFPA